MDRNGEGAHLLENESEPVTIATLDDAGNSLGTSAATAGEFELVAGYTSAASVAAKSASSTGWAEGGTASASYTTTATCLFDAGVALGATRILISGDTSSTRPVTNAASILWPGNVRDHTTQNVTPPNCLSPHWRN